MFLNFTLLWDARIEKETNSNFLIKKQKQNSFDYITWICLSECLPHPDL